MVPNAEEDVSEEVVRVVALRQGRLKPVEFRLREGETGLSLFAHRSHPSPEDVVVAVRAAGKQGDLAAAVIATRQLRALGLTLTPSAGGTPSAEVNAIHYEARIPWWRRLLLRVGGNRPHEYFNEHVSPKLCASANVLE
jgi:hypothetical protein